MRIRRRILFAFIVTIVSGANILIYSPSYSKSHLLLNGRIADTLSRAAHNVVMFIPEYAVTDYNGTQIAKTIYMRAISDAFAHLLARISDTFFESQIWALQEMEGWAYTCSNMCEAILHRKDELEQLRKYKFDVGFSEQLDLCGAGIIRYLGIPTHIWLSSGPIYESIGYLLGVPTPLSYVPIAENADLSVRMSFMERAFNFYLWLREIYFHRLETNLSTEKFRQLVDANFPHLRDIAAESALCFVYSDEFLDVTRPILHKTVYVGGFGISPQPSSLQEPFSSMMQKGNEGVILMSFGTVVPSSSLPSNVRKDFFKVFAEFSDYHFLVRISSDDEESRQLAKYIRNVDLLEWMPQMDILGHPRLRLFIMHGGQRGILESTIRGTPLLVVPFFVDQFRNARNVEYRGIGLSLQKHEINFEELKKKLHELLENDKYSKAVRRLSSMIHNKPNKPEEQIVKWTNFVAEFGPLPELTVEGAKFNFIKYFCLDVILVVFLALFAALMTLILAFRWVMVQFRSNVHNVSKKIA